MDGKLSQDFVTPRFSYGAIESALAAVFGADRQTQHGALRGRLKHLQRLGLGVAAGKGKRVQYNLAQASQWLLAMLMGEVGIDPVISVETIKAAWPQLLQRRFEQALDKDALSGNPIWLTLRPPTGMVGWAKGGSVEWIGYFRWLKRKPPGTKLTIDIEDARSYTLLTQTTDDEWLCARNLTHVMLKFVKALGLKVEEK